MWILSFLRQLQWQNMNSPIGSRILTADKGGREGGRKREFSNTSQILWWKKYIDKIMPTVSWDQCWSSHHISKWLLVNPTQTLLRPCMMSRNKNGAESDNIPCTKDLEISGCYERFGLSPTHLDMARSYYFLFRL